MIEINSGMLSSCATVTAELLRFSEPADVVLSRWFHQHRAGSHDRRFIAETAYAILRRRRWLMRTIATMDTAEVSSDAHRLVLAALIKLQGVGVRHLQQATNAADYAWVQRLKAQPELPPDTQSLAEEADLPDWLMERLCMQMSEAEALALARALNTTAPLDLRVNSLKTDRSTVLQRMQADGLQVTAGKFSPYALRVHGRPALAAYPLFKQGHIEVQDEGSQLIGLLLSPKRGEMVADFCAGAGGKTLLLGALMRSSGRLYAFDTSVRRLARLKPRLARSGLSNVHPIAINSENDTHIKRLAGKFDRVLVDAPCSGLGTLRRNPDLKWRQTPQDIIELTAKQTKILAAAARLVKPGGRLLYATCSILHEENAAIVDAFLASTPAFRRLNVAEEWARLHLPLLDHITDDLVLTPQQHATDGFYAALLQRAL